MESIKEKLKQIKANQITAIKIWDERNLTVREREEITVIPLARALKQNTSLTKLSFTRTPVRKEGAKALSEALEVNETLTTLKFTGNEIGTEVQAFCGWLPVNRTLKTLDLSFNYLNEVNDIKSLCKALTNNKALTHLKLVENGIDDAGAQPISDMLKTNCTLTVFDLSGNEIGDAGAQALSDALKVNQALTHLDLRANDIFEKGAIALSNSLAVNLKLTTFYFGANKFSDKGIQALSEALMINQTITILELDAVQMSHVGAQALSEMLKTNSSITNLSLCNNQVGGAGMQALNRALTMNQTLNSLNLWANLIDDENMSTLRQALTRNQTLTSLLLGFNKKISTTSAQELIEVLKINRTLINLNLDCINIGEDNQQAIAKALQANIAYIKNTRYHTALTIIILLRLACSEASKLPFELWAIIMQQLDFPSEKKGYRTSEKLVDFLMQKDIFTEFNQRLQAQQSVRLVEIHGAKLSESRFSFLVPFNQVSTPEIQSQSDRQLLFKK